ncbi:MAG: hypothetical protein ONB23_08425 [candidate division KSB1 bacterium]|nr:hypothetical protein [candidate division KSB1 bacterium]
MSERGYRYLLDPRIPCTELLAQLKEAGLFPSGESWWFAWNAVELVLPSVWDGPTDVRGEWAHFRLFSPKAELRLSVRMAWLSASLLTEQFPPAPTWSSLCVGEPEDFEVRPSRRVLLGKRMTMADSEVRGEVWLPRPLTYGIPDQLDKAMTVHVLEYRREAAWAATRYCRLEFVAPGSWRLDSGTGDRS